MKNALLFGELLLLFILAEPVNAQQVSYNLEQCYQHSLGTSASVALQQEILNQNESQINESVSHFYPTVNLNGEYKKQEQVSNPLLQNIYPTEQETVAINVSQSIFNGFKDYSQYKIQAATKTAQEYNTQNAKKQLYQKIVPIFYTILSNENILKNYQQELLIDEKRRKEMIQFYRFAKVKKTDYLSIEGDIANLEVEIETTKEQIDINRNLLKTVTGLDKNTQLVETLGDENSQKPLEFYLRTIKKRPEILSNEKQIEIATQLLNQTRGNYLPTLSFSGNYYLKRPDYLSEVHWDIALNATLPLFSGGQVQSQVAESVSVKMQKTQQLEDSESQAEQEIETLYASYLSDTKQILKLKKLVDIDDETQQAIYNNGLAHQLGQLCSLKA